MRVRLPIALLEVLPQHHQMSPPQDPRWILQDQLKFSVSRYSLLQLLQNFCLSF